MTAFLRLMTRSIIGASADSYVSKSASKRQLGVLRAPVCTLTVMSVASFVHFFTLIASATSRCRSAVALPKGLVWQVNYDERDFEAVGV